jgi:hypothetical protein
MPLSPEQARTTQRGAFKTKRLNQPFTGVMQPRDIAVKSHHGIERGHRRCPGATTGSM